MTTFTMDGNSGASAPNPIPNAGAYMGSENDALLAFQNAKTQLAQKQGQIWQKSGMTGNFDPSTGAISNQQVDPNNPYGDFQMMHQASGAQLDAGDEAAQSRGLFGSGLGQQSNSLARFMQGRNYLDFGRGLMDQLGGIQSGYADAQSTYSNNVASAQYNAALKAFMDKQYQTAPAPGAPGTDPGNAGNQNPNYGGVQNTSGTQYTTDTGITGTPAWLPTSASDLASQLNPASVAYAASTPAKSTATGNITPTQKAILGSALGGATNVSSIAAPTTIQAQPKAPAKPAAVIPPKTAAALAKALMGR